MSKTESKNEVELLREEIEKLKILVKKQGETISRTGVNVLEMQVKNQSSDMEKVGFTNLNKADDILDSDFASNEDLVQLVAELQGQLDTIEERSIRRTVNSTKRNNEDILAPLPNPDGDTPTFADELFPNTLKDFKDLSDFKLYKLAKFYEIVQPSVKESEAFEEFMEGKAENFYAADLTDDEVNAEVKKLSKDQLEDAYNDLARYLGVTVRRGDMTW